MIADGRGRGPGLPMWLLATVALLAFLKLAAPLFIPVVLSILISYALEPPVAWLERRRVPRLAGATLVMVVLVGGLGWGAYSLRTNIVEALRALPEAAARTRAIVESELRVAEISAVVDELSGNGQAEGGGGDSQLPAQPTNANLVQQMAASAVAVAGQITVVVFLVYFLLISGHRIGRRIVEAAGPGAARRRVMSRIIRDVNAQVERFLFVQLVTAVIVAVATWLALTWLDMRNAAVWAVLAGVFNSIPYFGPVLVSAGLFFVGLAQGGDAAQALQVAMAAIVITALEGWLLAPYMLGRAERMNALAVFLGLLLGTWLWGAWGTLLAVPVLSAVKAVADHVRDLRALGRLMAR